MKDYGLIINKPTELNRFRTWGDFSLTILFWLLIFYLWQPLIGLIAWAFGIKFFYDHMILLGGAEHLLGILFVYCICIAVLGGGLIVWAKINQWRFRGKNRRGSKKALTIEHLTNHYGLTLDELKTVQKGKNVSIWINDDFSIQSKINR